MKSNYLFFPKSFVLWGMTYKKTFPNPRSQRFTPISFPRSFIYSPFNIRMRIHHLELMFIYSVSWVSNFIILHMCIQLSMHHLLKKLFFSYCTVLPPLSKISWPFIKVNFWALNFIPFIYMSVFRRLSYCVDHSFVVKFEIGNCESFNIALLYLDYFAYPGFFTTPYEFWN